MALDQRPGGHPPSSSEGGKTGSPLREIDWEILPPEERRRRQGLGPLFKWLALVMDEFLRVPGTSFRFGLDPLIGLVPGVGDTASALVSAFALIQAVRVGVPKILLARMSLNILINELVGIVPIVGDAFSFWFKSNSRNYQVIKDHIAAPGTSRRSDWIFVISILALLFGVVCIGLVISFFFLWLLATLLAGSWAGNHRT